MKPGKQLTTAQDYTSFFAGGVVHRHRFKGLNGGMECAGMRAVEAVTSASWEQHWEFLMRRSVYCVPFYTFIEGAVGDEAR